MVYHIIQITPLKSHTVEQAVLIVRARNKIVQNWKNVIFERKLFRLVEMIMQELYAV